MKHSLKSPREYKIQFHGPFRFLGGNDSSVFKQGVAQKQGIYLWTVPCGEDYLPYYIGETGDSFAGRLKAHIKEYLSGTYRVYEPEAFLRGEKILAWKGMWIKGTEGGLPDFLDGYLRYAPKIRRLIATFELFLAPHDSDKRTRKRIEGAIAHCLFEYQKRNTDGSTSTEKELKTFIEKEDRNRHCRRKAGEEIIKLTILGGKKIIGLEEELSI